MFVSIFGRFMMTSSPPAIAHEDLVQALNGEKCVVVDVREPHEYVRGHIPGAVNFQLRSSILTGCRAASVLC